LLAYFWGLGVPQNLKKSSVGQVRDIFKTVREDGKLSPIPSYCAVVLHMTTPTSEKKLDFEKSNMA
jgi:hypothetical protein